LSKSKKKTEEKNGGAAVVPDVLKQAAMARLQDEEGQMRLPVLFACLVPQYDGTKLLRPAGKISISVEGVYWRVQLDLPYERLTCRMFGPSLATVLEDINAYLGGGKAVFGPMFEKNKKPLPRLDAVVE
jgi:hypothetical protein